MKSLRSGTKKDRDIAAQRAFTDHYNINFSSVQMPMTEAQAQHYISERQRLAAEKEAYIAKQEQLAAERRAKEEAERNAYANR